MKIAGMALRVGGGALLAWWAAIALVAPEVPRLTAAMMLVVAGLTFWRPSLGLLAAACVTPIGGLLAPAPARTAELLAFTVLSAWLLRVWTPLAPAWTRASAAPAALYLATVLASWLALTIGGAAGVAPTALPRFVAWLIPPDYLIFSTPEPETWTMLLNVAGLGLFFGAAALSRLDRRLALWLAATLAVTGAALSLATVADVARQWADADYGGWFLRRYTWGERFSLHLADPNAAASLYALSVTTAGVLALLDQRRRWLWIAAVLVMSPGILLAGSVSAILGAVLTGVAVLAVTRSNPRNGMSRGAIALAAALFITCAAAVVLVGGRTEGRATAGQALAQRIDFLETTARMFGSAPVFGVGVGRYFERSPEFMPEALRAFYGNENAHSYFAQQFAELGIVGGALFIWLVAAALRSGWGEARGAAGAEPSVVGLTAGVTAYLLTCVAGHPLLVPAAALPFWAAFGVVAGAGTRGDGVALRTGHVAAAVVVAVLAIAGVVRASVTSLRTAEPPRELGFHSQETDEDGAHFRWMTRHAVTYIPAEPGVVTLRLRRPDEPPRLRPLIVEIAIEGRPLTKRLLPDEEWTTINVGVRGTARAPFRRIDLRANQEWSQEVRLGQRSAARPISIMVGAIDWTPLDPVH